MTNLSREQIEAQRRASRRWYRRNKDVHMERVKERRKKDRIELERYRMLKRLVLEDDTIVWTVEAIRRFMMDDYRYINNTDK